MVVATANIKAYYYQKGVFMLAEFLGAVIVSNQRYLIEPVELNSNMYVQFPRVEAINAIAKKEEILKFGIKEKYHIDLAIEQCLYQEDFMDGADVISFAYYKASITNSIIPEHLLWIEQKDMGRLKFALGDNIVAMRITQKEQSKEEIISASYRYVNDKKGVCNE